MHDLKDIAVRIADFINSNGGSVLSSDVTLKHLSDLCYCIGVRPAIEVVAREVGTPDDTSAWRCDVCGGYNADDAAYCVDCHKDKP